MKINAVITKPKKGNKFVLNNNISEITVASSVILLGIITGASVSILYPGLLNENVGTFFVTYFSDYTNKNFLEVFSGIFIENLLYIIITIILGSCIYGVIPLISFAFLKTLGLGAFTGYIFNTYGLKGLEFYLLTQFPGKIVLIFCILFTVKNCLSTCKNIKNKVIKNISTEYQKQIYIKQTVLSVILVFLSALIDTVMIKSFSSLFNFH